MTIVQDLGLVETVLGDVVAFASGQPVKTEISGWDVELKVLTAGPTAPYTELSGGIVPIIDFVFTEYVSFSAGQPVQIAVKENKTWYGLSLSKPAPTVNVNVVPEGGALAMPG